MSWDEWLFKKAYGIFKGRSTHVKRAHSVDLSDLQRTLEVAFEAITGQSVIIQEAQEFVGYYKGHLFLPQQIGFLPTHGLNKKLYWILTCFHAASVMQAPIAPWQPDLLLAHVLHEFPGLAEPFQALPSLGSEFLGNPPVLGHFEDSNANVLSKIDNLEGSNADVVIQKKGPNVAEFKELDETKENPLVHMFEKVNTVESYMGGNKTKQAEDSLEKLDEALSEVQLRNVIRSTERTPGLIKTNSIVEAAAVLNEPQDFINTVSKVFYPEWDQSKRMYRKDWCAVTIHCRQAYPVKKIRTVGGQKLKMRLESIFNHFLWEGRQTEGPDLDLQPVIENKISKIQGGSLSDRIFVKRIKQVRDFEVLIMMDESLSTESFIGNESVLGMMKDSVCDLAQAFESAPDQLSVMSFFSETRINCNISVLKDFSESIETLQTRLTHCRPQGYTRIGVAIRHATEVMKFSRARKRCIVLVTDAKPTDVDRYEGRYGMADVKKAVDELYNESHELIVLSYADREDERFARMFPKKTRILHVTNKKAMTSSLIEVIERLAIN